MGRVNVRDGFWVLLAALWCVDEDNLLPLFLTAALVHEAGHAAVLYLAGGHLRQLTLTACGAVMQAVLPCGRFACAAVSLAGPAAGFALTIAARACGGWRLAGASALLSLFNLLPLPPLDGGMALAMLGAAHRHGNMYFSTSYEKMQRNMCILTGFCAAFCIVFPQNGGFAWHSLAYGRIML